MLCDLCGEGNYPGDPVVEYGDHIHPENAHIECAQEAGWED